MLLILYKYFQADGRQAGSGCVRTQHEKLCKEVLNNQKNKKQKQMTNYSIIAQCIIALSIVYVWVFRFNNIVKEFNQYGLSDLTRNIVGTAKIVLSTLLVAGAWYPALVLIPALLLAFLMVSAQYFHFKVGNPWQKYIPSLLLLILSLFIAAVSLKLL